MQNKNKKNRKNYVLTFDYVNKIRNLKIIIHRHQQNNNDFEINKYNSRKFKNDNRREKIQSIKKHTMT